MQDTTRGWKTDSMSAPEAGDKFDASLVLEEDLAREVRKAEADASHCQVSREEPSVLVLGTFPVTTFFFWTDMDT